MPASNANDAYMSDNRAVLIFADTDEGARNFEDVVTASGKRIAATLSLDAVHDRLEAQSSAQSILVDIANPPVLQIDALVSRVERFAESVRAQAIFAFPAALLDTIFGTSNSDRTTLLCDPGPADRFAAFSLAAVDRDPWMADSATDIDAIRLKRLADEVHRIARALNGLSVMGDSDTMFAKPGLSGHVSDMMPVFAGQPSELIGLGGPDANEVRNVLRLRRLRDRYFDAELFADPAWDILLDLLAARIEGDQVAVSSLCIAAAVPPTTALRWIKTMTDTGLLERHADPMDGRRIFIRLTDKSAEAMGRFFAAAKKMGGFLM